MSWRIRADHSYRSPKTYPKFLRAPDQAVQFRWGFPLDRDRTDVRLGRLVAGRYRIVRPIGEGGMGDVYEAVQEPLGRRVALKVLHSRLALNKAWVERFRREAELAASLGHPNIVQATDFGATEDGHPFLVMDLVVGVSLGEVLEVEHAIDQGRTAFIGDQILAALETAHRSGFIHRDLKPDNVLLTSVSGMHDIVKILDFGIAGLSDTNAMVGVLQPRLTHTGQILGTPSYMSPEHARGQALDERSDLYSVGVILYECLAGHPPIEAESYNALLFAIVDEDVRSLVEIHPEIDPELANVISRALAKAPEDRFPDAASMRRALKPFVRVSLNGVRMAPSARPARRRLPSSTEAYAPHTHRRSTPTSGEHFTRAGVGLVGELPDELRSLDGPMLSLVDAPASDIETEPESSIPSSPSAAPTVAPPKEKRPSFRLRRVGLWIAAASLLATLVMLAATTPRSKVLPNPPEPLASGPKEPAVTTVIPAAPPPAEEVVEAEHAAPPVEEPPAEPEVLAETRDPQVDSRPMRYRGSAAGVVSLDALRRTIGSRMPIVRRCYAGWSIAEDDWVIDIDPAGRVAGVAHAPGLPPVNPKLRRCMTHALVGIRLGPTRNGAPGKVRVSFGRGR